MGYQEAAVKIKNDADLKELILKIEKMADGFGINFVEPLGIFKSLNNTDYLCKGEIYLIAGGYERHVVNSIAKNPIQMEYILENVIVDGDAQGLEFFKNDNMEYVNYDYHKTHPNMFSFENWHKTFSKMLCIR